MIWKLYGQVGSTFLAFPPGHMEQVLVSVAHFLLDGTGGNCTVQFNQFPSYERGITYINE